MIDEEQFIDCKCPHCGEPASFRDDRAGRVEQCPSCSEEFVVPADSGGTAATIPLPMATSRLNLRRLTTADWKDLLEILSDEELYQYVEEAPPNEEQVLKWLDDDAHVGWTTQGVTFSLAMELQSSRKVIGVVYLNYTDEFSLQANVRIYVGRKFQCQGFATEALGGVFNFCFAGIGLHRVSAWCDRRNVAASRVLEKAGMRCEGEFLKARILGREWIDTVFYAMLEEEFGADSDAAPDSNS
jgi:RimJ/RimL family protein N-acetyltransferase